ncbi:endoplasmic reticulum resident protein 27 [Bombina bombina]|uniref:endoplasmic reticulum resident protein 27 n=1 Tax=Bombina bombina TaxID=8345 RepID=UPI00235A64FF|nr:endoplasmic reticulum resident protein 27 [Bombina bombina]
MALYSWNFMIILLLARTVSGQNGENSTITNVVKDPDNEAKVFDDISEATAFIDSSELAVIAFFQDSESKEEEYFKNLVKDNKEWDYGVSYSKTVLNHFNITSNTLSIFRKVDSKRIDLEMDEVKDINTVKLYRFLTINDLRLVTEYNPMTAIGIFESQVKIHLLLFMEKGFEKQEETLMDFRKAAEDLRGKVLFISVDVTLKGNEKVMFYFGLRRNDLPKVAIYNSEDESKKVMNTGDINAKQLTDFCYRFLSGENMEEESEQEELKTEL